MNILHKDFRYVSAAHTDIRKTFERHREAQQMRQDARDFMAALHEGALSLKLPSVRYDLTPEQRAQQEADIKRFNLPF